MIASSSLIRRYEKGKSIKSLSQELNISQSTICQWRKTYCLT
ncbi:helix-turn-helix domain-containing protein [uncultured Oscillibacter sp.]